MTGGCHCGAIRYEITGSPFDVDYCHCSDCRKTIGAPFGVWMDFKKTQINWVKGSVTEYASSEHIRRGFCAQCGSSLSYRSEQYPDYLTLSVASLDDPNQIRPNYHIYTDEQACWLVLDDRLPKYPRKRTI